MSAERREGRPSGAPGGAWSAACLALVLAVVAAAGGCAGGLGGASSFERHFDTGRYERAVDAFEADSALQRQEEPLYRAGLLYATPGRSYYDPGRARQLLERLLDLYPYTRYRPHARGLLALVERVQETSSRLAGLQAELRDSRATTDSLETRLRQSGVRTDSLERELEDAALLEEKLEEAVARAARLEKQLEQLKRVHLQQAPDTGDAGSRR